MKPMIERFNALISPYRKTPREGILFWQEKVMLILFLVIAVLGLVTYIPSILLAIKESLWVIVAADTIIYFGILVLFLNRNISFTIRALGVPVISYLLGIILLTTLGPFGAGPVWLFFFPTITSILIGRRAAYIALVINFFTIVLLGVMIQLQITDFLVAMNFTPWFLAAQNSLTKWIIIGLNFMLLNVITTLSITTILEGLQKSIDDVAGSEKKYRRIFENILDVYFETHPDGTLLEVSPSIEKISDFTAEELKGQSLFSLYHHPEAREETIRLLLENGTLDNHEIEFVDKDGRVVVCSINARLITNSREEPEKVIGILRDTTQQRKIEKEKKELEERLARSSKMEALGLLAGGVAHDLNNILSGIITYPELLAMDMKDDDPLKKPLGVIQSSGQRAARIVQDLLTLSRRGVVTRETLSLNDLALQFFRTPEYQKILSFHPDITVEKKINAESPWFKGSSVHIQKTIMNLISNAAEAQPGGGYIIVKTENRKLEHPVKGYERVEKGSYVVLSVQDFGTGIAEEDMARIFEPFFTKKVMGRSGTGLGMAVVWGTVQDHDGYIDILSQPDVGTTFELYFQVCDPPEESRRKTFQIEDCKGNGETILVVDDVREQREIAKASLERLGYRAEIKESGEAAVDWLRENRADLIILDMIMPGGMDGLETYRSILKQYPEQKAIIASGFSQTHQVKETLALGAGDYLQKPYTIEKLGLAVRGALSKPS